MKHPNFKSLRKTSNELRYVILEMLENAKSGHPGGSLSSLDLITVLYFTNILDKKKIKLKKKIEILWFYLQVITVLLFMQL